MIIKSLPELLNSIRARVYWIIGCDVLAMVTIITVRFNMKNRWIITSVDLACIESEFDLKQSIISEIIILLSYTYFQYAFMLCCYIFDTDALLPFRKELVSCES